MSDLGRPPSMSLQAKRHGKKRRLAKNRRIRERVAVQKEPSTDELVLKKALDHQLLAQETVAHIRGALEKALSVEAHASEMVMIAAKSAARTSSIPLGKVSKPRLVPYSDSEGEKTEINN